MRWWGLTGLVLCACLTHQRAALYQSDVKIWRSATQSTPTFRAWMNYRNALLQAGDFEQAAETCGPLSQLALLKGERAMFALVCVVPPS